jgi:hypothetical protein
VHVVVDEPQGFASSIPAVWQVTRSDLAIVRFHGRNEETWEAKGLKSAAERFNYLYSEAELRELATYVKELAENAEETHALYNNCFRDYGQRNAMDFRRILAADVSAPTENLASPKIPQACAGVVTGLATLYHHRPLVNRVPLLEHRCGRGGTRNGRNMPIALNSENRDTVGRVLDLS